jgi:hypothetical protein
MSPINYDSLNQPVKPVYFWLKACIISLLFSTAAGVYMGMNNLWNSNSRRAGNWGMSLLVGIILSVFSACIFLYTYNRRHDRKLEKFARDNGWQRVKNDHDRAVAKLLDNVFDNINVEFDIQGTYQQYPMHISHVECTPENFSIYFNLICLKIDLPKSVPLILLKSKTDRFDITSILASKPDKGRLLQLEGNFKDVYNLYVKENTERDVLEVLTPDVMYALMNIQNPSNISMSDKELCLFIQADDFTEAKLERLFNTADTVIKELL